MGRMGWQESVFRWRESFLSLADDLVAWLGARPPPELRPCPVKAQLGTRAPARCGLSSIELAPFVERPGEAARAPSR